MRSGDQGAAGAIRLWWALPLMLAIATAVLFVAVVLPRLAGGASVPAQLIVHRSPSPATVTPSPSQTPHPARSSSSPDPARSTTVVPPEQPVVHESEDRHDDHAGHGSGDDNDR